MVCIIAASAARRSPRTRRKPHHTNARHPPVPPADCLPPPRRILPYAAAVGPTVASRHRDPTKPTTLRAVGRAGKVANRIGPRYGEGQRRPGGWPPLCDSLYWAGVVQAPFATTLMAPLVGPATEVVTPGLLSIMTCVATPDAETPCLRLSVEF